MAEQPIVHNTLGCILTVGVVSEGDRMAMVMPFVCPSVVLNAIDRANDLVASFIASQIAGLTAQMAETSYISFLNAEGMTDGTVPFRHDFAPTAHNGAVTGSAVSSQTAPLISFYEDPADVVPGKRIGVAKTFFCGFPVSGATGDNLEGANAGAILTVFETYVNGFASLGDAGTNWYRVLSAPKPRTPGTNCKRIVLTVVRGRFGTQRRRMFPYE